MLGFLNDDIQIPSADRSNECSSDMYMLHLYCLAEQAGFYSDAVECRTLSLADQARSPVGENVICIFSPVTTGAQRKKPHLMDSMAQ